MKILIVDVPGARPATAGRALGRELHRLGHGAIVHPLHVSKLGFFRAGALRREAEKILHVMEPDVLHVMADEPWVVDAFVGRGVPVVHSALDRPSSADWVLVPSPAVRERTGEDRITVMPYALEIPEDDPLAGTFVLSIVDPRDFEAMRWLKAACEAAPEVPVRTAGDPRDARFVVTLSSKFQAWPRGVAEAMAAARPVVANWGGAAAEFVVEGVTGFLSAPGDVKSVGSHLRLLWGDVGESRSLGLASREEARERFGGERLAKDLVRCYLRAGFSRMAV